MIKYFEGCLCKGNISGRVQQLIVAPSVPNATLAMAIASASLLIIDKDSTKGVATDVINVIAHETAVVLITAMMAKATVMMAP